jgi:hypothetical protein
MRRVFGPRTVVEAAFLIAVPIVFAFAFNSGMWTIIAASAVGYLIVVVLEATLWREGGPTPALSRLRLPSRNVVVKRAEPEPAAPVPAAAEPVQTETVVVHRPAAPEPPAPEPEPAPEPAPPAPVAPAGPAPSASEHVRVLRPDPAPEPTPEPVAVERPALASVPEPVYVPEPEPAPAPAPSTVVPIGVGAGPRQWNLWDLERLTREHSGPDPLQDEERQYLLMYLREFADSDGLLPIDFDGLVRDSFGELVGAR